MKNEKTYQKIENCRNMFLADMAKVFDLFKYHGKTVGEIRILKTKYDILLKYEGCKNESELKVKQKEMYPDTPDYKFVILEGWKYDKRRSLSKNSISVVERRHVNGWSWKAL